MSHVQNAFHANKWRPDMSSRQSRTSHFKLRRPSSKLLFLLRRLFLCFLRHGGDPLLKDRKLSRNRFAQNHTMCLQVIGSRFFCVNLKAVTCLTERTVDLFLEAASYGAWVNTVSAGRCPLCPRKRPIAALPRTDAKGHKRHFAVRKISERFRLSLRPNGQPDVAYPL